MHDILNLFKDKSSILWKVGSERGGVGCGSILWADKSEILQDNYKSINQVIGHTSSFYNEVYTKNGDYLYFIDNKKSTGNLMLNL